MSFDTPGLLEKNHNSDKIHTVTADLGGEPIHFEVGRVAKQASGAIWVTRGGSTVLVTVCRGTPRPGLGFFPLTCEYIEKTYAAGKIPGGFFKREARPRDAEVLNARMTDRSVRPLFPDGYKDEVQIISTVISHDGIHETEPLALCGASMALTISEIPWASSTGPIAGVRVSRIEGELVVNPTVEQRAEGDMDLFVAMSGDAIVMVEGGAQEVTEDDLLEGLFFAHDKGQTVIKAIHEMREAMGKPKMPFESPVRDTDLFEKVKKTTFDSGFENALATQNKIQRYKDLDVVKAKVMAAFEADMGDDFAANKSKVSGYFGDVKYEKMRGDVLSTKKRLDNRAYNEIRNIDCEVGALPRTHGSALFTRGETQAVVTTTLGTRDDEQKLDGLLGQSWKRFMLHYNFPPFCVGEARMLRTTSRREIGHGTLAQRAIEPMLPEKDDFPYTVRIVSEITESNGSSSMASVCGGTMALYDAGVPMKAPVAGIAMGLIQEGKDYAVLSDILGDEDHLGDMDFKVCGTDKGITAIQMDIKIEGLERSVMKEALYQAAEGRKHILAQMAEGIAEPRAELSPLAPRIVSIHINPDKIRDIIGPGGKTIRDIVAKTGAKIDVTDDGTVNIAASDEKSRAHAEQIIQDITRDAEVNRIYKGLVRKTVDFGAFVEIFPGTDGLIHISELADKRVERVSDVVEEGDEVLVKCLSVDRDGKIRLSRRQAVGKEVGTIDVGD